MSFFGTLSAILSAEPLKKKRKMDPAIVKIREDRRRRKLEKQIRRLEKNVKQLKPIAEVDIPFKLIDENKIRLRNLPAISPKVIEERLLIQKQWSNYKMKQHIADMQMMETVMLSQQKALDELRAESEELYEEAIQLDLMLVPYSVTGPVCTSPIKNYDSPDGDYIDVSRKWE